jgi:hypothetical protein
MVAECSSETLVSTYTSTGRYNPEDQHRHVFLGLSLRAVIKQFLFCLFFLDISTQVWTDHFTQVCSVVVEEEPTTSVM